MPFVARKIPVTLNRPLFACAPPGDTSRLFVVEQGGTIRILDLTATPQALKPTPFLTLSGLATGNEQGLLGLVFHPKFATNRTFFVNYTDGTGGTVVERYTVPAATPDVADPATAKVVLKVPQPFENHNGGWMAFGPDGFLYLAMGDGGAGDDPGNRAQNLGDLLGKMLRIDADGDDFPGDATRNYAVPPSNPFVTNPAARKEIWAFGLRNPWRCAFDRKTGELYIADVGQNKFEELNVQPAGQGGQNYGWRLREGRHDTGLDPVGGAALTDPVHEYPHSQGRAIIGGYVYRGTKVPELVGKYLFADMTGPVWSLTFAGGTASPETNITTTLFPTTPRPKAISSFGEDAAGEVYLLNLAPAGLFRIEPVAPAGGGPQIAAVARPAAAVQSVTWAAPASAGPDMAGGAVADSPGVLIPSAPGTPVQEARALLQVAAAIEHALLLQYLYASYSLDKQAPGSALAYQFLAIAVEEMGHLMTVQNLLLAIGGQPYFARESPMPANDPFAFRLQPASATSLAKYVTAESPLREHLAKSPELQARADVAYALAGLAVSPGGGVPTPGINHVGILYAKLYWLFQKADAPEGPWKPPHPGPFESTNPAGKQHIADADFVDATKLQVSSDEIGSAQEGVKRAYVAPVRNRAEALAALHQIAAQGEGWAAGNNKSHFVRFLKAFEDYIRAADSGADPTLPVPTDPTTGDEAGADRNRITHPASRVWAELCDVRYQMLIGELWLAISLPLNGPDAALRQTLFVTSVYTEMVTGVTAVARKLASLPRRTDEKAPVRAGAPFRMVKYADLPNDAAGWKTFLRDRIAATAALRVRLEALGAGDDDILNPLRDSDNDELLPLL